MENCHTVKPRTVRARIVVCSAVESPLPMDAVVTVLEFAVGVVERRGLPSDHRTHQWWGSGDGGRTKEYCPDSGADPTFEIIGATTQRGKLLKQIPKLQLGMCDQIQSKHCSKCVFKETCKVHAGSHGVFGLLPLS